MDFHRLVEAAPDAIVGVAGTGLVVLANREAHQLFGYEPGDLLGQRVELLVPGAATGLLDRHRASYQGAAHGPDVTSLVVAARRRDGSGFPAELSVSMVDAGDGPIILAVVRDGTDRTFAAVVASTTTAVVTRRLDGTITSWNPAAEHMSGYAAADIVGRNIDVLLPADRHAEDREMRARVVAGHPVEEFETVRVREDGTELHLTCRMVPLTDASGHIIGVTTIAHDITALKRAEAERERLLERLHQSQRLESLGQLAGGIAHDFNNLLAVILGYVDFVAEAIAGNQEALADLAEIRGAAERASHLTQQLLIFGRREAVGDQVVEVNSVVADVRRMLSRTIGAHIDLVVRTEPELSPVMIDRGRLEQVLVNLAVNARDAMPEGGTLAIETRAAFLDEELCRIHPGAEPGPYVQLAVSDTGVGMSKEVLGRVLEPFFTTKPKGVGTGLGLPTVYGIVRDAKGTLTLYSEVGLGTTVNIHLPVAGGTAEQGAGGLAVAEEGSGETILVVEDEDAVRAITCRILRRHGYDVIETSSARDALATAVNSDVDLVLTDVVMPHMSGRELAEALREVKPELPVLFMSGYSQGVLGPGHLLAEGVQVLQKPFHERTLLAGVHDALGGALAPTPVTPGDASAG